MFEDNLGSPARARLLHGHLLTLDCPLANDAPTFFDAIDAQTARGRWVALIANYELASAFEPRLSDHRDTATPAPLARALVFEHNRTLEGDALADWWQQALDQLSGQQREAGLLHLAPQWQADEHATRVSRILDYIRAGDCYQANLTFPLTGQSFGHPLALYAQLRERQPVQHGALIHDGQNWLLSRSPERFFTRHGDTLSCRPMKGTAPRAADATEDAAIASSLQGSEKNRAENLMIVDLIRNDLGRLAPAGKVSVSSLFALETYATVHQLTSTVEASGVTASTAETFRALFPCGSVTGAPKLRAMQIIDELEAGPRGAYCGAIGWLAPDGDADFNVPIRTLLIDAQGHARLDVGSGIVADSDPAAEYDECLTKARFVRDDGLQLIETLRCEVGPQIRYPMLPGHIARLEKSARTLGIPFSKSAILATLAAQAATLQHGTYRMRLTLARDGRCEASSTVLAPLPPVLTVTIASERLDPDDLRLQHKTTARRFYDTALERTIAAGHFDLLFFNTRDELCEGARSNVFIERNGVLLTPPLSSGLLPGVLRAQLIAEGRAQEGVLTRKDLDTAEKLFVGNALRGLMAVRLIA
ncbi:aminodeoxychorismate synthase component I [Viridibacterium curvum]|uniref:Aminodeoxychorismate synthase component I n=1 Tax=Viridibacterium curvum TaxID=1101404 RepID=A0ABP9R1G7_9RHOO